MPVCVARRRPTRNCNEPIQHHHPIYHPSKIWIPTWNVRNPVERFSRNPRAAKINWRQVKSLPRRRHHRSFHLSINVFNQREHLLVLRHLSFRRNDPLLRFRKNSSRLSQQPLPRWLITISMILFTTVPHQRMSLDTYTRIVRKRVNPIEQYLQHHVSYRCEWRNFKNPVASAADLCQKYQFKLKVYNTGVPCMHNLRTHWPWTSRQSFSSFFLLFSLSLSLSESISIYLRMFACFSLSCRHIHCLLLSITMSVQTS